jgi:hypothetical protein
MTGDGKPTTASNANRRLAAVGLPPLVFMFTIDQISSMMNMSEKYVRAEYLFYLGRSTGLKKRHHMNAVNIAPEGEKAEWRVSWEEFLSWLKKMGFKASDVTRI